MESPLDLDISGVPDATVMAGFSIGWIQHVKHLEWDGEQIVMICECSNRVELGPAPSPDDVALANASCEQYMEDYLNNGEPSPQLVPSRICTVDAALWFAEKVAQDAEDNRASQALCLLASAVRRVRQEVN